MGVTTIKESITLSFTYFWSGPKANTNSMFTIISILSPLNNFIFTFNEIYCSNSARSVLGSPLRALGKSLLSCLAKDVINQTKCHERE